jgi:hypothetical protein
VKRISKLVSSKLHIRNERISNRIFSDGLKFSTHMRK